MKRTTSHIPMWLLAELTFACPVQCSYCSNPLELSASRKNELSTEEWVRVMRQARKLGAVQLGFSGGEPLVRTDLEELVVRIELPRVAEEVVVAGMEGEEGEEGQEGEGGDAAEASEV